MPSRSRSSGGRGGTRRRSYHHGDLRQALLDAALDLLRSGGTEALTLRAVAREVGVSQTAPYRHFTDRRALVAGVAEQAFARMGDVITSAVRTGEPGLPALRRGLAAYVAFAHQHPAEYRVMFGPDLARRQDLSQLEDVAVGVFNLLHDGIARLQHAGLLGAGDTALMAITAWATLHGLVMLSLDGQAAVTGRDLTELVDAATGHLLKGMGAA